MLPDGGRQHRGCIIPQTVTHSLVLLKMGKIISRNILICCWPCILVIINFRFQLNAQYFISLTMLLYMFRVTLRPSSGGPLHIYLPIARSPKESDIEPDVVDMQGSSWRWAQGCPKHVEEHIYLPTARSPKETDIEPDVVDMQGSSWRWAQGCPKHVEEHS